MSRYLEEAAAILRKADKNNSLQSHDWSMDVAHGFAMLAAIDKGLLPAEITADVLRAIADRHTV